MAALHPNPDVSPRAHADRLRVHIQEKGMQLLLDRNGYRILKRINQFSRPAETLGACKWLLMKQDVVHRSLRELPADVHARCAVPVLHATIDQLVRTQQATEN